MEKLIFMSMKVEKVLTNLANLNQEYRNSHYINNDFLFLGFKMANLFLVYCEVFDLVLVYDMT